MTTVSVLMPVYNAGKYLDKALESIAKQTHLSFEVLILDDGSTDNFDIVEAVHRQKELYPNFRNVPTQVIFRPHQGIVESLNELVIRADGKYIARMDADDIAFPERLEQQVQYLASYQDCVLLGTLVQNIDECDSSFIEQPKQRPWFPKTLHAELDRKHLICEQGLHHPTIMVRADVLRVAGAYRPEYEGIEDFDLFLRLAEIGRIHCLSQVLHKYRVHDAMTSRNLSGINKTCERLQAETLARREPRSIATLR